jgi:hypothetical protein
VREGVGRPGKYSREKASPDNLTRRCCLMGPGDSWEDHLVRICAPNREAIVALPEEMIPSPTPSPLERLRTESL